MGFVSFSDSLNLEQGSQGRLLRLAAPTPAGCAALPGCPAVLGMLRALVAVGEGVWGIQLASMQQRAS